MSNIQLLTAAYMFAADKHRDQRRKNVHVSPYINHPIDVAYILTSVGITDINTLIGGILHDTVEDTKTSYDEIIEKFGQEVADIVRECSDNKALDKVQRKKEQLAHARIISDKAKLIKLADKFSNCRELLDVPPKNWSQKVIYGYAVWCFAVCQNLFGINDLLDRKLMSMFQDFGISDMDPLTLNDKLEEYYSDIQNSN